ncbi:hypothetical protein CRG98_029206 [Punica granatum]|uniref:QLQ domain-containing protein n=1 Tax=Punica granatum TaxID=22663 RepID=A0A2I0J2A9_PUNGR|nr:hypothetical protein CRG98_029206 [Punica granatum]
MDPFSAGSSSSFEQSNDSRSTVIPETNVPRNAAIRDTGKSLVFRASALPGTSFSQQQLKQLRAQCLVFLALRNGLTPKPLHLEIALGNIFPRDVALVMLFWGENGNERCHYLSCVSTSRWSCEGINIMLVFLSIPSGDSSSRNWPRFCRPKNPGEPSSLWNHTCQAPASALGHYGIGKKAGFARFGGIRAGKREEDEQGRPSSTLTASSWASVRDL